MPRRNHPHTNPERHDATSIADGVMYFTGLMMQRAIKDIPYAAPGELPRVSFEKIECIDQNRQSGDEALVEFDYSIKGLYKHIALKGQRTYFIQRRLSPDEIKSETGIDEYVNNDLQEVYNVLRERDPKLVWPEIHGRELRFIVLNPLDVMAGSTHRHAQE